MAALSQQAAREDAGGRAVRWCCGTTRFGCRNPGSGHPDRIAADGLRCRCSGAGNASYGHGEGCRPNGVKEGVLSACGRTCQATRRPAGVTPLMSPGLPHLVTLIFERPNTGSWPVTDPGGWQPPLSTPVTRRRVWGADAHCTGRRRVRREGCSRHAQGHARTSESQSCGPARSR